MISKKGLRAIIEDELRSNIRLDEQFDLVPELIDDTGAPEGSLGRPDLNPGRGVGPTWGGDHPTGAPRSIESGHPNALLAGEIAIGMTPAGVAIDARDTVRAIRNRDPAGFGLAIIGFIPWGGDWLKGLGKRLRRKGRDIPDISATDDLTLEDFEMWDPRAMDDVAEELGEEGMDALERRARGLRSHDDAVKRASREGVPTIKGAPYRKWARAWDILEDVEPLERAEDLAARLRAASGAGAVRRQLGEVEDIVDELARRQKALVEGMDAVKGNADHWVEPFAVGLDIQEDVLRELSAAALPQARRAGMMDEYAVSMRRAVEGSGLSGLKKRHIFGILLGGAVAVGGARAWSRSRSGRQELGTDITGDEDDEYEEALDTGEYTRGDIEDEEEDDEEEDGIDDTSNPGIWENKVKINKRTLEKIIKEEINRYTLLEQVFDSPRMDPEAVLATQIATGQIEEPENWPGTGDTDPYEASQWGLALASFFPGAGEVADVAATSLYLAEALDKKQEGDEEGYEIAMGNAVFTAALIPIPIVGSWLTKLVPNSLIGWFVKKFSVKVDTLGPVPDMTDEMTEVTEDFASRLDDLGGGTPATRQQAQRELMTREGLPVRTGPDPDDLAEVTADLTQGRELAGRVTQEADDGIRFADEITSEVTSGSGLGPRVAGDVTQAGSRTGDDILRAASEVPVPRIRGRALINRTLNLGVEALQKLDITLQYGQTVLSTLRRGAKVDGDMIKQIGAIGTEMKALSNAVATSTKQAARRDGTELAADLIHWKGAYQQGYAALKDMSKTINREIFSTASGRVVDVRTLRTVSSAWQEGRGPIRAIYEKIGGGRTLLGMFATGTTVVVTREYFRAHSGSQSADPYPTSDSDTGIDSETGAVNDEESISVDPPDVEAQVGFQGRAAPELVENAPPEALEVVDNDGTQVDVQPLIQAASQEAGSDEMPSALSCPECW